MAKPVILGVEGYAADLLERMQGGICIEPENEGQLVEALNRFASDSALASRLGVSGRDYVLSHFDLNQLASDYMATLQDILGIPHEGAART